MNLRDLNIGTPKSKFYLKPVFSSIESEIINISESVYKYEDTPTNLPDQGSSKLYIKQDGKVYTIDSAGLERIVGDGTGDLTELENKAQNISLADTVLNTTVFGGRVLSDTMFYDDASENAIFTSGVGGLTPLNFRHTSFGVGAGITSDLSCNFGFQAGENNQGSTSVAIGVQAGQNSQGNQCVAIGEGSGKTNQGNKCVAVGDGSGGSTQGANSIAIGYNSGGSFQPTDSIILNATGGTLNNTATNEIRLRAGTTDLIYNATGFDISTANLKVATINNLTPVGGFFSQITSIPVNSSVNPPVEFPMIANDGVGERVVPANAFIVGGTYRISQGGFLSCVNNATLTIRIYGGGAGNVLLGALPTLTIPTSSNQWFGIESYFVVRALGGNNVAEISARVVYTQNVDNQNAVYGQSFHTINNSTFNSTVPNKLQITAQWGAQNDGLITTTQATFHRIF